MSRDNNPYTEEDIDILKTVYPYINGSMSCQTINNIRVTHDIGEYGDIYSLYEEHIMWMNTSPISILDHASILTQAKGSCIFTGLGLGLCTILACINTDITDITVIENNPDIISMWEKQLGQILPRNFPCAILIENADTYTPNKHYDFAYFDHSNYEISKDVLDNYNATIKVEWYKEIIKLQNRLCQ